MKLGDKSGFSFRIGSAFMLWLLWLGGAWGFDEAEPLPKGLVRWQITHESQTYDEAYNKRGRIVPLHRYLIRDKAESFFGGTQITRETAQTTLDLRYGLSNEAWIALEIPWLRQEQTIDQLQYRQPAEGQVLDLDNPGDRQIQTLRELVAINAPALVSDSAQGLGDVALKAGKELKRTSSLSFNMGGGLRFPTGKAGGTPRGIAPIAIGDRQSDLLGFLHFFYYPHVHGLSNAIYASYTYQFKGKRETLTGLEGEYFPGNRFESRYNWTYQRFNAFVGGEFQYLNGTGSSIAKEQQDDAYHLIQWNFQVGFGNLSDLEKGPMSFPYQVRLGVSLPAQGRSIPKSQPIQASFFSYF